LLLTDELGTSPTVLEGSALIWVQVLNPDRLEPSLAVGLVPQLGLELRDNYGSGS